MNGRLGATVRLGAMAGCFLLLVVGDAEAQRVVGSLDGKAGAVAARARAAVRTTWAPAARRELREPPAPWLQNDPGEELYRRGRQALNAGDYLEAAGTFRELRRDVPESGYVAPSLYWEAFARYRTGEDDEMGAAAELLAEHLRDHPDAPTVGEARNLLVRIRGAMARRGDAEAAAAVTALAREAAGMAPMASGAEGVALGEAIRAGMEGVRAGMEGMRAGMEAMRDSGMGGQGSPECRSDDHQLRVAALNALLQMDDERALPVLEKTLERRGECAGELRQKAVFLISQQESDRAVDLLVGVARDDPDPQVRRRALFWLGHRDSDRAVEAIEAILRSPADSALHERAVFALAQNDSERADRILRDYALREDVPAGIRAKAIFWLGQGDDAVPVSYFRTLYGKLGSRELKEKVLFAVAQREGGDAGAWLLDVARDGSEPTELRKKALFWAGQSGVPLDDLRGLYEAVDERAMREQVIFALSQRDEPAAVDELMEVARSDPDPELRKKAIFWLGQSDDPRVADFLMEIVNAPREER